MGCTGLGAGVGVMGVIALWDARGACQHRHMHEHHSHTHMRSSSLSSSSLSDSPLLWLNGVMGAIGEPLPRDADCGVNTAPRLLGLGLGVLNVTTGRAVVDAATSAELDAGVGAGAGAGAGAGCSPSC